jgi:hypothetical protein
MDKELRTKIKVKIDTMSPKELKKVNNFIEKLSKLKKTQKAQKKAFDFTESCVNLVTMIQQNLIPKIDAKLFSSIAETIHNDKTYIKNCEFTLNNVFETLNSFENAGNAVILYSRFLKGFALLKYTKNFSIKVAEEKFVLKKAQICAYISFSKLVLEYNWLIFIGLDFTKLTRKMALLKQTLKKYEQLKTSCSLLQFPSISVDFEAAQSSGNNAQTNAFTELVNGKSFSTMCSVK